MEFIPKNPILNFKQDQMKTIRKQYNLDRPGDMSRAIDILETWIKMQKHFVKKELPRNYLEKTILASKGSLERAKKKLDKMCTVRTLLPAFFGENLTKNKFEDIHNFTTGLLSKPTDENYRVYLMKVKGLQFTYDLLFNYYKYIVLVCEYFMTHDYCDGVIIIVDFSDTNLTELIKALNLTDLGHINAIVNEGFGLRIKRIYLMTASKVIDTLVAILKQLITTKLGSRICVHKDMNAVHPEVPREILPVEYGGKEKSLIELHDELREELTSKNFIDFIDDMSNAKTDESYRERETFNGEYLGMPGSFRTLNVD